MPRRWMRSFSGLRGRRKDPAIKHAVMKQFLIFVRKEIYHIWRDRRTLLILTAILDESRDAASISLIQEIGASRYFNAVRLLGSPSDIGRVFRQGKTRLVV